MRNAIAGRLASLALLIVVPAAAFGQATVPGTHTTIQDAVNAVQGTGTPTVTINSSATFSEQVLVTQTVTIAAGPGFTPVIRPPSQQAIRFQPASGSQTLTLRGLRIEGGGSNSSPIVDLQAGGSSNATVIVDQSRISNPLAETGAIGLNVRSASGHTGTKSVTVTSSTIAIDTAVNSGANAISMLEGGTLAVTDSTIVTSGAATALDVRGVGQNGLARITLTLLRNTFNIAAPNGPYSSQAIWLIDDVNSTIGRNTFNLAASSDPNGSTSALLISYRANANVHDISRNLFVSSAPRTNRGISATPFSRGFSDPNPPPALMTLNITNNVFRNLVTAMSASPQSPGDIATIVAVNNTIDTATTCLSLYAAGSARIDGRFNNNLCTNATGQIVPPGEGPGYVVGAISASAEAGGTIAMTFSNNGYFGNTNGNYGPTVPGVANVGALVTGNPLYVNRLAGDLRLLVGSQAIDNGLNESPLVTVDYAGTSRPQGPAYDIGAYEGGVLLPGATAAVPAMSPLALIALTGLLVGLGGLARSRASARRSSG